MELTIQQIRAALAYQVNSGRPIILSALGRERVAGEQLAGINDGIKGGLELDQPFVIVRVATFDEWWESIPPEFRPPGDRAAYRHRAEEASTRFYEVTTD